MENNIGRLIRRRPCGKKRIIMLLYTEETDAARCLVRSGGVGGVGGCGRFSVQQQRTRRQIVCRR